MTGIYVLFFHIIGKPRKSRDMIPWNLIKNMISVEITDIVSIIYTCTYNVLYSVHVCIVPHYAKYAQ